MQLLLAHCPQKASTKEAAKRPTPSQEPRAREGPTPRKALRACPHSTWPKAVSKGGLRRHLGITLDVNQKDSDEHNKETLL